MSKPSTLHVRASHPERPVPKQRTQVKIDRKTGRDLTCIYHDAPEDVPNTSFYRRAIRRGDLEEVPRAKPEPKKAAKPAVASKKD